MRPVAVTLGLVLALGAVLGCEDTGAKPTTTVDTPLAIGCGSFGSDCAGVGNEYFSGSKTMTSATRFFSSVPRSFSRNCAAGIDVALRTASSIATPFSFACLK